MTGGALSGTTGVRYLTDSAKPAFSGRAAVKPFACADRKAAAGRRFLPAAALFLLFSGFYSGFFSNARKSVIRAAKRTPATGQMIQPFRQSPALKL